VPRHVLRRRGERARRRRRRDRGPVHRRAPDRLRGYAPDRLLRQRRAGRVDAAVAFSPSVWSGRVRGGAGGDRRIPRGGSDRAHARSPWSAGRGAAGARMTPRRARLWLPIIALLLGALAAVVRTRVNPAPAAAAEARAKALYKP